MAATFFNNLSELGLPLSSSPMVWNCCGRGARSRRVVSTSRVGSRTMNGSGISLSLLSPVVLLAIDTDADGSRHGERICSGGPGRDECGESARASASRHDQQIVGSKDVVVGGYGIFGEDKLVGE